MTAFRCAACGDPRLADLGETREGRLQRCRACRSLRLHPLTDLGAGASAAGYSDAYRRGLDPTKREALLRLFRECASDATGRLLLDVGGSDGSFASAARGLGWTCTSLDRDPEAVAAARARGLEAVVGCADDSAALHSSFDVVTLWDLLEHVPDPDRTAAWLSRCVRPDGRVVVVTPVADGPLDRLAHAERALSLRRSDRLLSLCVNRHHLHRFSRRGLASLFLRHGFRIVRLETIRLFSLRPEHYLSGFAPGMEGWTGRPVVDAMLSRIAYAALRLVRIRNKLLLVAERTAESA